MPRLILKSSKSEELFDMWEEELTIGRSPENELPISDSGLSRQHCRIFRDGNGFSLEDLESSNGTRVNGKRIDRCRLRAGDVIILGRMEIRFDWLPDEREELGAAAATAVASDAEPEEVIVEVRDGRGGVLRSPRYRLVILGGKGEAHEFQFDEEVLTIGRGPDQRVQLDDEKVSGRHARLIPGPDGCCVLDENSRNGTYVDGQRVQQHALKSGEILRVGRTEMRFLDLLLPPTEISGRQERPRPVSRPAEASKGLEGVGRDPDPAGVQAGERQPARSGGTRASPKVEERERSEELPLASGPTAAETAAVAARGCAPVEDAASTLDAGSKTPATEIGLGADPEEESSSDASGAEESDRTEVVSRDARGGESRKGNGPGAAGQKADAPSVQAAVDSSGNKGESRSPASGESPNAEKAAQAAGGTPSTGAAPSRENVIIGTTIAVLIALAILGGAIWFVLPEGMRPFSRPQATRAGGSDNGAGREPAAGSAPSVVDGGREGQERRASEGLPAAPPVDAGEAGEASGTGGGGVSTAGTSGEGADFDEESSVPRRPLNATRRVQNYDFLKDLAVELANMENAEPGDTSDARSRQLARVREMLLDFRLEEAERELGSIEGSGPEVRGLRDQLQWIQQVIRWMDECVKKGETEVRLGDLAAEAPAEARVVGVGTEGLTLGEAGGPERAFRWAALKPAARYELARRCSQEENAAHHVGLAVLCLNLKLVKEAEQELAKAERLGFKGIERYQEYLRRQIDILR
ncbi:MAG: FHA domain-containing protein [Planctomycetes bacterium]|nr:FHA domain-containing protein [Planctomycetota bacterium]